MFNELIPVEKTSRRAPVGKAAAKTESASGSSAQSGGSDQVTLSSSARAQVAANAPAIAANPDIRYDVVKKFRNLLKNDTYQIKSGEIADKIVQKIRENKNPLVF